MKGALFGCVFALSLSALSVARADSTSDINAINNATDFIDFAATATICAALDYPIEEKTVQATLEGITSDTISQSSNPAYTQQILEAHSQVAFARTKDAMLVLDVNSKDNRDLYEALDSLVKRWTPACNGYASKQDFAPFIKPSPMQSAEYPPSAYNFARAGAEAGRSKYMAMFADMHGLGYGEPDKDHKIEFTWTMKAAQTGEASAAFGTASNYFVGRGTSVDYVQAEKWYRIALKMGFSDRSSLAIMEKKMTATQIAAGKAAAHKWLVDNEYE